MDSKFKVGDWVFIIKTTSWLFRGATEYGIDYCRILKKEESDEGVRYFTMNLSWKDEKDCFKTFKEAKLKMHELEPEINGYLEMEEID